MELVRKPTIAYEAISREQREFLQRASNRNGCIYYFEERNINGYRVYYIEIAGDAENLYRVQAEYREEFEWFAD